VPIAFASPSYLLLLVLVPAIVFFGRRSLAGLDKTRRRLALLVRCSSVVLIVLALAEVQWEDEKDKLEVSFLLDRSRSVPEELRDSSLLAFNEISKSMGQDDLTRLIVFGKDASVEEEFSESGRSVRRIQSLVVPDQTDIEAALDTALNAFGSGVKKRIVLFSDGNETSGDAGKIASLAHQKGVIVDVVPLRYNLTKEIFVEKVVLPSEVKVGEPYIVRVVIRSLTKTTATLELYEDGQRVGQPRRLELEPGVRVEKFARVLKKTGFFNVRALLKPEKGGDHLYQNNKAFGFVYVRGESKVLYIYGQNSTSQGTRQLKDAMRLERINFKAIAAAEVPKDENVLQQYDAIILDNVAKYELTLRRQAAIERSVKNMGLGLVMIGGPDSFGAGGWEDEPKERTPIERALPVYMEPKQKTVIPNGALAIIMHSCEFANGNDWGRKVTMKAVQTLSAKDYVGVVFYSMRGSEWCFRMQKANNKKKLKNLIRGMEPGDMPDFDSSMRMAINGLIKTPASLKHMIILSDGDPSPPAPGLLKTCRDKKITITTICIKPHGGPRGTEVSLMKRIANSTGGKFYYLRGPKGLPKIFVKETKRVARPLIRNVQFVPRVATSSPIIKGFESFPKLNGHVLATAKKRASVVLNTPEKESQPILVHWRWGVGKTVAFTSDASPRWAGSWIQWPGYASFWGQLIRWVGKDVEDASFQVSTKVSGDMGKIVVDAINEDGEFIDKLTVNGVVASPDGKEKKVILQQVAPGRYAGEFPVGDVGNYTISLLSKGGDSGVQHAVTSGLVFPYSEEFKRTQSDDRLLSEIARLTGGRVVKLEDALKGDDSFYDHELVADNTMVAQWPFLMLVLLVLFPIDVFLRRVMLDYGRIGAWLVRSFRRQSDDKAVVAASATLDRLRARKLELQGQQLKKFEPTAGLEDAAGAGYHAGGHGTGAPSAAAASGDGQGASQGSEKGAAPVDFTSRLLEAKRRAQRDFKDN
jgi:uncharacterized membrane protein